MARIEVPVWTQLRFTRSPVLMPSLSKPESVSIEFDGHEIGWVAPCTQEGQPPSGPTVTMIIEHDVPEAWRDADETIQRFLSALAFDYETRMESEPRSGGSGETDLLHPYGHVAPAESGFVYLSQAPKRVHLDPDPIARLAVGVYREAISSGSPFYRFLAFWNVIETVHDGSEPARDAFLRCEGPKSHAYDPVLVSGDIAEHLRDESRNAVAHVIRRNPTDTSIDPDRADDRERLDLEARWIRDLARRAILSRWPTVVRVERDI